MKVNKKKLINIVLNNTKNNVNVNIIIYQKKTRVASYKRSSTQDDAMQQCLEDN